MIPIRIMEGVSRRAGVISMQTLSRAPMAPLRSATPIPSMPTRTTPSGANSVKFFTMFLMAQKAPSPASRPVAVTVSTVLTLTPSALGFITVFSADQLPTSATCDRTRIRTVPAMKRVMGWGRRLPTRSIQSSQPDRFSFSGPAESIDIPRMLG